MDGDQEKGKRTTPVTLEAILLSKRPSATDGEFAHQEHRAAEVVRRRNPEEGVRTWRGLVESLDLESV